MMLYEIEYPGWPGESESYRRVYVIASTEEQALQLALDAFQQESQEPIAVDDLVIDEQVTVEEGFCSKPSNDGLHV
jgi:hypothetical protein